MYGQTVKVSYRLNVQRFLIEKKEHRIIENHETFI